MSDKPENLSLESVQARTKSVAFWEVFASHKLQYARCGNLRTLPSNENTVYRCPSKRVFFDMRFYCNKFENSAGMIVKVTTSPTPLRNQIKMCSTFVWICLNAASVYLDQAARNNLNSYQQYHRWEIPAVKEKMKKGQSSGGLTLFVCHVPLL